MNIIEYNRYFEIYKICIEQADKISERRMKCNNFFIILLSTMASFISAIVKIKNGFEFSCVISIILCITLCIIWEKTIESYKMLNSAKFKVILKIENHLCINAFAEEWDIIKKDGRYTILSKNEQKLPSAFLLFYLALFICVYIKIIN